jgi:integrative and conjugative element protein (TIGR02256 family)
MIIYIKQYTIVLHVESIRMMNHFTQLQKHQPEAGGIILGQVRGDTVQVLKLSPPTELDKASRYNFERHRLSAQIIINYEFFNSHQQTTYLGEWHSHPEDLPTPSPTDERMIEQQFRKNQFQTPFLLLLIKGQKGLYVRLFENDELNSYQLEDV